MSDLKHVGILGMKWGRRKGSSASDSADHTSSRTLKKKKTSQMSNEELKKLAARLQLEKQVKDLSKKELTGGKKVVMDILGGAGKQTAITYVSKYMVKGIDLAIKSAGLNL